MSKLDAEMKKLLEEQSIWVLATADSQGVPNAVPINFTKIIDDSTIMLVDNLMNKTLQNLRINPQVSVSVWLDKVGYQFKGKARYETSGALMDEAVEMVRKVMPISPKGIVLVDIDSIYITSPGPDAGKKVQ